MKLTKAIINGLQEDGNDRIVWDSSLPGFGVRVNPGRGKSFLLQYRNRNGRSKRITLGAVGVLTLDQAKKEATRLKGSVCIGEDPAKERTDARSIERFRDIADRYMSDHCEGRCKESTMKAHRWLLDKHILPKFGTSKISELTPADIARYHQSLRKTPYNANRALGLIKAIYNKSVQWGLITPNDNPAQFIKPFRENKRQRYLSAEEFKRLFATINEMQAMALINIYQAGAITLLALTGCRLSEILTLEWADVDMTNNRLLLAKHKTDHKGIKAIPINNAARKVLERLPKKKDNPHVIVGREKGSHIINLQKPWRRIRERAGLEDVRIHDLRHSFASAAASAGVPLAIIGGMLGHSSPQTTARYAHLSQDPIHQASEIVGKMIEDINK